MAADITAGIARATILYHRHSPADEYATAEAQVVFGFARRGTVHNAATPAENKTVILEWVVEDLDAEYTRLKTIVRQWEQEPSLMPWGNRSILFRDPDGNLINLCTPATDEAIQALPPAVAGWPRGTMV